MEKEPKIENKENKFLEVDRKSPEIMNKLDSAPIYQKQGFVQARKAEPGEEIVTILEGENRETKNEANNGDWVVTNPSGEQYIIPENIFFNRYKETKEGEKYMANGYCRAIQNPFGESIQIMAQWGSLQTGDEQCMIVDTCDANGNRDGEPYLVDKNIFDDTYKRIKE